MNASNVNSLRTIIFDLDGTLVDSSEGVVDAVNYSLRQLGRPEQPPERIKPFIGFPLAQMYADFTDAPAEELYRHFQIRAAETVIASSVALPHVDRTLAILRKHDVKLAIASTKIRRHIDGIVDKLGWRGYFDVVVGGDEVENFKPSPDVFLLALERLELTPDAAIVVGDTLNDILAAKRIPIETVGIISPYGDSSQLRDTQPDHLLEGIAGLPDLLRGRLQLLAADEESR